MKQVRTAAILLSAVPLTAAAFVPVSEPGTLPLLAIGGAVALAVYVWKRRQK